ncbi:RRP15-like protein [Belonocnema kinseyi]|uniref:RRP15-like protein n=1 Tax=Belonocnema kinseyi TaxID=2817044 RepID=UPI00143D6379|nr:RRP15-like protein [Belonocnema kinseyi]XP_033216567.1 RRP15-like protein [Belonocnema kinseyi]
MISLETSVKVGKSPKKLPIAMSEEDESGSETGSENVHSMDGEENMESADEGIDNSSGDEGDNSNLEDEAEKNSSADSVMDKTKANPNWADAMRKVLHTKKPKRKKTIVLSKARKLCDIVAKEKKESLPFEIEGTDGEITKEIAVKKETEEEKKKEEAGQKKRRRKEIKTGIRIKPSILDRERERTLQKIATKGVVQLFNAVRQQQMEIEKKLVEAGPVERKREKVLKNIDKRAFLDVLMGGTKSILVDETKTKTENEKEEPEEGKKVWKVLREDFVMGASLKDWDKKKPEVEDDSSGPEEVGSDE